MVIQELKPSRRIPGRWLAVLEDGSILRMGEEIVVSFALYTGKELEEKEVQELCAAAQYGQYKQKAIALLTRKPLSRKELARTLETWGAEEDAVQSICQRMEELGVINDAEFAVRVVTHYTRKGYGAKKVRDELYRRGVPRDLWEGALRDIEPSDETIDALIQRRLKGQTPDRGELKRLSDMLARRGFGWSEISEALRRYGAQIEGECGAIDP